MEIKTKFKIGDRLCFIENGVMVFDTVESISVYQYDETTKTVYYYMEGVKKSKNESEVCLANETSKPIKCNKL